MRCFIGGSFACFSSILITWAGGLVGRIRLVEVAAIIARDLDDVAGACCCNGGCGRLWTTFGGGDRGP